MNCFYHPELIAVAVCQDCARGLCSGCASKFNIPICFQCNGIRVRKEQGRIRKEFNQYITAGILMLLFMIFVLYILLQSLSQGDNMEEIATYIGWGIAVCMFVYYGPSMVAGWKTLGSLTSRGFVGLPIIGWLIYVSLKLMMASLIGPVMLPVRVYKNIKRLDELKEIAKLNAPSVPHH